MDVLELLKTLTATPGPSGMESDIATVIAEIWRPFADEVEIDHMGNVIATKFGSGDMPDGRPRLMLSAHMDEIALMVTKIESHNGYGFLRVTSIGGIDKRQMLDQRVTVHGKRSMPGITACLPSSMLAEDKYGKVRDFEDMLIDVGLSAETTESLVSIGDFVTFDQPLHKLLGGNVATKALDNRACVAALTVTLKKLQKVSHAWDIVVVATIQEETSLLGGALTSFSQTPDAAIALDVAFATQTGVSHGAFALGSGPILDIGIAVHPGMLKRLRKSADALEMKYNSFIHTRHSGTETDTIQLARAGVPTGLISIPIRYMHTVVETVAIKDIKRTGRLVAQFASSLDEKFLPSLQQELMREPKKENN